MTANLILSVTVEQKTEDGLINAPAEIVARESNACRRVIFWFICTSFVADLSRTIRADLHSGTPVKHTAGPRDQPFVIQKLQIKPERVCLSDCVGHSESTIRRDGSSIVDSATACPSEAKRW